MKCKRPVIGLTVTQNLDDNTVAIWKEYMDAIAKAGGLPLLLPTHGDFSYYPEYLDCIDGLFLTGGQDIMPSAYGEESLAGFQIGWSMVPERDAFELEITKQALARNMPILGVCRGIQVLGVALGGSLVQDIDTQCKDRALPLKHFQECPYWAAQHRVTLDETSKLYQVMGQSKVLWVNSMHHQAVCKLGEGVQVAARSTDGIIEAIEAPAYDYVLGVQWHPERMYAKDDSWYDLFHSFIEAAQK